VTQKLLDLFCGAGGAGMGYHRAGFHVTGVDLRPQKNYPFHFVQADALAYLEEHGRKYDVIHASPPCQMWSTLRNTVRPELRAAYVDLITPLRPLLLATHRPYVIENVRAAPLHASLMLCGQMFSQRFLLERWFECSHLIPQPIHPPHTDYIPYAGKPSVEGFIREVKGVPWMTAKEARQAISPNYTLYIGSHMKGHAA
jgi:DNA (cytosine-5)-methyltransferase 1